MNPTTLDASVPVVELDGGDHQLASFHTPLLATVELIDRGAIVSTFRPWRLTATR
jgi:hypothetical protein